MSMRFQKGDLLAIAIVVALAVLAVLAFLPRQSGEAAVAQVYQDGRLVGTLPLDQDGCYTATGKYTNEIVVKNGAVSIAASTCPGQDCIHCGRISAAGRSIVCLPNGLEVRIVGIEDGVDFVVG